MYNQFLHFPAALVLVALVVCTYAYAAFSEWLQARAEASVMPETSEADARAQKELLEAVETLKGQVSKLMFDRGLRP